MVGNWNEDTPQGPHLFPHFKLIDFILAPKNQEVRQAWKTDLQKCQVMSNEVLTHIIYHVQKLLSTLKV